jgi:tRNA(Ile)-lysidine synthase
MPPPPSSSVPSARPAASAAEPVAPAEFAAAIAACAGFEPRPHVAVAVSGGPDSMALAHLLSGWLAARSGRLTALIVDHRLRPESAREAQDAAETLRARGLAAEILAWQAPRRGPGLQAAARAARYALLAEACRQAGILHLCLAHHLDDQAETLLQRVDGGSGPDGLAAMPRVAELSGVRLLRPLLSVPKARLVATCRAAGLGFAEDPSNADPRFGRTEVRARLARLARRAPQGLDAAALAGLAGAAGRARAARDDEVSDLMAGTVRLHPAGFARIAPDLAVAPDALALRALSRVLACVGGAGWPPRTARLKRALAQLRAEPARPLTLGGCRLLPQGRGRPGWLAVRETVGQAPVQLAPGARAVWDGRFLGALDADAPRPVALGALGPAGWRALAAARPGVRDVPLPAAARDVLPAFFDLDGLAAVPHLDFVRNGLSAETFFLDYRPVRTLGPASFAPSFTVA